MFQLEGYFRTLLRDAAIFKRVGKLIFLPNPHQKLRLREQLFTAHAALPACTAERGEIDMGSQVLLARGLIRIGAGGVMAVRHERAAVTARELLVARVTVVNNNRSEEHTSELQSLRHLV